MFHWKAVFIGWCYACFYDNIKNYGQQKKTVSNIEIVNWLHNISAFTVCWTTRGYTTPHNAQNAKGSDLINLGYINN